MKNMKKMKKVFALILASMCVVTTLSLTGCRSASSNSNLPVLTVGLDDTYPPMEYQKSGSTTPVGFDIDMAKDLGKDMGMKVKFQSIAWDGIFTALNTGKYDCIISSVSMTDDRMKAYAFTKPYIANAQMIVVKKGDNSITKQSDLAGKKVGCQVGTTANDSATTLQKSGLKFSLTTYDQIIQTFEALKSNKINAVIVDEVVGEYYINKSPKTYQAASVNLTNEPIGICFRKNESDLRDKAQTALDKMSSDGTLTKISKKWFGKDLTSNIDTKLKML